MPAELFRTDSPELVMTSAASAGTLGPNTMGRLEYERDLPLLGSLLLTQREPDSLNEVQNGGLRHPVQQRTIKGFADQAERRLVSRAQAKLGPVLAKCRDLQLTFQRWKDTAWPRGPPGDRQPSAPGSANRRAKLHFDALAKLEPTDREADLGEKLITTFLGR